MNKVEKEWLFIMSYHPINCENMLQVLNCQTGTFLGRISGSADFQHVQLIHKVLLPKQEKA
jgi:hypothetical protein